MKVKVEEKAINTWPKNQLVELINGEIVLTGTGIGFGTVLKSINTDINK